MRKLALGQISVRVLMFSLAYIILPILHTHLHVLDGQTGGRIVETFQMSSALSDIGELVAC